MKRFSDSADSTVGILELIKSVIIDLIEGYSSSNTKLRAQAENVFGELFDLLSKLGCLAQLF
jgi:hypothetical protein